LLNEKQKDSIKKKGVNEKKRLNYKNMNKKKFKMVQYS
jgi:hypothetical protein